MTLPQEVHSYPVQPNGALLVEERPESARFRAELRRLALSCGYRERHSRTDTVLSDTISFQLVAADEVPGCQSVNSIYRASGGIKHGIQENTPLPAASVIFATP